MTRVKSLPLARYYYISPMKNNPFGLMKKVFFDFLFHRIVKKINAFVLIFNLLLFLLQICYVLRSTKKKADLSNYGPTMGILFFVLCEMLSSIRYETELKNYIHKTHQLSWELEQRDRRIILQELKFLIVFGITVFIEYLISIAFLSPFFKYEQDIFLIREIFDEDYPKFSKIFETIFWITAPALGFSGMANVGILAYFIATLRIQLFIVNRRLSNISKDFNHFNEIYLCHSVFYQREISKRLRFLIKRHSILIVHIKKLISIFLLIIQIHVFVFFLVNLSMIFLLINLVSKDNWMVTLRSVHLTLTCFSATIFLISLCQFVSDKTAEIFDTTLEIPWHLWNAKNRKMLLFLKINSMDPLYIKAPHFGCLGYRTIIEFCRGLYSTTTILYKLRN